MSVIVLFAAEGIPPSSPVAQLAVPFGILIFLGSIYLLLRSNLGTRRGYLVMATSFFGFMIVMSAFWAFGAPGTPVATGPTNLPGQAPNEYVPHWTPFAGDSRLAQRDEFSWVADEGNFGAIPDDFQQTAGTGVDEIRNFFSTKDHGELVTDTWVAMDVRYAQRGQFPVLRVEYQETDDVGEPDPEGDSIVLFGFFDQGAPSFPAIVFLLISLVGFAFHALLLDRDERRARRELGELRTEQREPVGADA